jgi:hypothetical protein
MSMRLAPLASALFILSLPATGGAATIQILSSARSVTTSAYATDDVIEFSDADADTTLTTEAYSETAAANLLFGPITCDALATQTSAFAASAFHAEGTHSCFSEDTGTTGFGMAAGSSTFHVVFRLTESSDYELEGFVEGADLGFTTITFSGPGGTILSLTAGGNLLPVQKSGVLMPGDYDLNVNSYGSAHGWPPFPSWASGAFEIHFALSSATDAPHLASHDALRAYPNPFTTATRIQVPDGARGVRVFDATGRLVRTFQGSAFHDWDGRDEHGAATPAGVYFVRAEDSNTEASLKLVRVQ